jgi:hypothetical protein
MNSHWPAVVGRDDDKTTFWISDPDGGDLVKLSDNPQYQNSFDQVKRFRGPQYTYTLGDLVCYFFSPGELLLTDPQGRRTGMDPRTGQSFRENANSSYTKSLLDDHGGVPDSNDPVTELHVHAPPAGDYTLSVIGTGTGTYDLELVALDAAFNDSRGKLQDVPITPGEVHTFGVHFDAAGGGNGVALTGSFDGGGQRPRDVNTLLSYVNPTQATTDVSPGTSAYRLMVVYGQTIEPGTFRCALNGVDVTSLFHPAAGATEIVELELTQGRNVVQLSVDGVVGTRLVTDRDRLVFRVP